jgi:hypothetical protein
VIHQLFAQTRVAARNSRLSLAEAILADYYQDIMSQNVALRSLVFCPVDEKHKCGRA